MMARLNITGARAATPNRPSVLRIADATAPSARKMGDRTMIRVSWTVTSVACGIRPGNSKGTSSGAQMNTHDGEHQRARRG